MSNSSLVDVTILSPNYSTRKKQITKITIHHMAGNLSVETCGNVFKPASRKASSNYGIGTDGRVGLYVDENNRAWTSGSSENDQMAVTIEVANNSGSPNWTVSDKAYSKLIDLCVDICQRNGIKSLNWTGDKSGNLTCHYMFQATACPGPYLKARMSQIANKVNSILNSSPEPVNPSNEPNFIVKIANCVNQYREKYNIKVASPIIAQAVLESAMGTSAKAQKHNYFGLKYRANRCPTSNGTFVDTSKEQNPDGSYRTITDEWFSFPDMENGVIGYFDFTNISNYANLKGVTDPRTYLENIKADHYASSQNYVENNMAVIEKYNLTQYDTTEPVPVPEPEPISKFPYQVRVNTSVLNVRSGPGTSYPIKTTVRKGQVYTIVDEINGWGKLKSGAGWICLVYTIKL